MTIISPLSAMVILSTQFELSRADIFVALATTAVTPLLPKTAAGASLRAVSDDRECVHKWI